MKSFRVLPRFFKNESNNRDSYDVQASSKKTIVIYCLTTIVLSFGFSFYSLAQNRSSSYSIGSENGHRWIDLGLSVKWADSNIGASKPNDYGAYYLWGEISAKAWNESRWDAYKYAPMGGNLVTAKLSKYNSDPKNGTVDRKKTLDIGDDAARMNWGGNWRIPRKEEWEELCQECEWIWIIDNEGVIGYQITSRKNGNCIFLPAAGILNYKSPYGRGYDGHYWSSTVCENTPHFAYSCLFHSSCDGLVSSDQRADGLTIRPVMD